MTRPTNAWGSGDLPAPWAEDDVVDVEGDAWYVRLTALRRSRAMLAAGSSGTSDRLHIAYAARCSHAWTEDVDWMAGVTLVHTDDLAGLALRDRMLAAGWTLPAQDRCPTCGKPWG